MEPEFDFRELFVLDLANNHQGSVEHGLRVVRSVADVVHKHGVRAALKFQFRQLDSFIHPAHREGSELQYIQRFQSTRLDRAAFQVLLDEVRARGLLSMCTPFDEESVPVIVDMGFDLIKVASCSAQDWPLLEEVADAGKPVVVSTGGLSLAQVDKLVSFLEHRGVRFALMHCVSIYPTPDELLNLNRIGVLRARYRSVPVGWSTHEDPDDTTPVGLALALGAQLFERHVGVETDAIRLNAYSSTPEQLGAWLAAFARARRMLGDPERPAVSAEERAALDGLRRGVYARRPVRSGRPLSRADVYFAMPFEAGQLDSGSWKDGSVSREDLAADAPLRREAVDVPDDPDVQVIKTAIHEVKALLNEARIALGPEFTTEYSHHYGIARFRETGAVIIQCINREYCKKLVVQLPGQRHPSHYHARKEETFQVLHGVLHSELDGIRRVLQPGETLLVQPGVWHSFWTETGVVFEEVSTTHFDDDSFYADKRINKLQRPERKTVVDHWGRFELAARRDPDAP